MTGTVVLVSPLTIADFDDPRVTISASFVDGGPQLGILSLAATLRLRGFSVRVANLNHLYFEFVGSALGDGGAPGSADEDDVHAAYRMLRQEANHPSRFLEFARTSILAMKADIWGFGTICNSYPLTLRLAREVKAAFPGAPVVLGGPQASIVDRETLEAFPFVDAVLRGEADWTLPALTEVLAGTSGVDLDAIDGLTFRRGGEIRQVAAAANAVDVASLPMAAYDLDPELILRGNIELEAGRGCPFACTFCSTNDFFRRNFRLVPPALMWARMEELTARYGSSGFSFVHDMFTVNRKLVIEYCNYFIERGARFQWSCSARTDSVDPELLGLMGEAGCKGVFFGVEVGSPRMQRIVKKRLDLDEAVRNIEAADAVGIGSTVALITGFPEETREDLRQSAHFFLDSARLARAEPQMSVLAPLAGTPLERRFRDSLIFDSIFSDISFQGWRQDEEDIEWILRYPDVFPNFYGIPTPWLERSYYSGVRNFLTAVVEQQRWLALGMMRDSGDILSVYEKWDEWRRAAGESTGASPAAVAKYHMGGGFDATFLAFARHVYLPLLAERREAIETLLLVAEGSAGLAAACEADAAVTAGEAPTPLTAEASVLRIPGLRLIDLPRSYTRVLAALRDGSDLGRIDKASSAMAVCPTADGEMILEISPESRRLLELCVDPISIAELASAIEGDAATKRKIRQLEATPAEFAVAGVKSLLQQRLLVFH